MTRLTLVVGIGALAIARRDARSRRAYDRITRNGEGRIQRRI